MGYYTPLLPSFPKACAILNVTQMQQRAASRGLVRTPNVTDWILTQALFPNTEKVDTEIMLG